MHTDEPSLTSSPSAPVPSFEDNNGNTIHVGDNVMVTWAIPEGEHPATITSINDEIFEAIYEDGLFEHRIDQYFQRTHKVLTARTNKTFTKYDKSVEKYMTTDGNIKKSILTGTEKITELPTTDPNMTQANAPPEPETITEAMCSSEALNWLYGIVNEYQGHTDGKNHDPTFLLDSDTVAGKLHIKWAFKRKWNNGTIEKHKARMCVAATNSIRYHDYLESYTGVAPMSDLRDLECLALIYQMKIREADMVQAYVQIPLDKPPSGIPIIVKPNKGMRTHDKNGNVENLDMQQNCYGLAQAGFALGRNVHDRLINRNLKKDQQPCPMFLKQCPTQPVIFTAEFPNDHKWSKEKLWLWINNDNFRTYSTSDEVLDKFHEWFGAAYTITGGVENLADTDPDTCLGVLFTYGDDSVKLSMDGYIERLLTSVGMENCNGSDIPVATGYNLSKLDEPTNDKEREEVVKAVSRLFGKHCNNYDEAVNFYRSLVSSIGWLAKQVGPSITYAHSIAGRAMHAPSAKAFTGVKQILRYIRKHPCELTYVTRIHLNIKEKEYPQVIMQSDASYGDDQADNCSQGGYIGMWAGIGTPTTYSSTKSHRVLISTYQAESYHCARACREAEYKRNLYTFLGVMATNPITLEIDNMATVLAAGAPIRKFSPNSKQFAIEEKYVVQCVEENTVIVMHKSGKLPTNPRVGEGFMADAMTKPLPGATFNHYRQELQGRAN